MTKIARYPNDLLVSNQDRLVGTDANGNPTKNYRVSDLGNFFKNSFSNFDGVMISVLDSRFGVVNDGFSDDWSGLQACADYCSDNNYTMYIPYTGVDYLISRPIVPHRRKGLTVFLDALLWATDPAFDKINLNGCVFAAGCLTHPLQKKIELLDGGAYLHRLPQLRAGSRSISIDSSLYNLLSIGDVVLLRSDLLAVDRTGDAPGTVPSGERFGVYNFSELNKIISKSRSNSGEYIIDFEHAIEEDVYEPRLLRFPEDQYIDTFREDPRHYIGPCQNFHLMCGPRGGVKTSGNQSFIQATCLYDFSLINVNVIDAAGGILCNALNNGDVIKLRGNCRGSSLEIAFASNRVRCVNIFPTVRGRGDRTNPQISITGYSFPLRNKGAGAISSEGIMDYNYDAVWYASDNKMRAMIYNKDDEQWDYFSDALNPLWEGDSPLVLGTPELSGWGSDIYVPEGTEGGITVTKALSENKSTVNIHEGARNISIDDVEIVVSDDYDFIDQDINIVGSGIRVTGTRIYSNKFINVQSGDTLEGDSISIGNAINGGDIPFSINDIEVDGITTTGRPVNAIISVTDCPLFPGQDNTTITLQGNLAGNLSRVYNVSIASVVSGSSTQITFNTSLNVADFVSIGQSLSISGASGSWASINGAYTVLSIDSSTAVTINFDSSLLNAANYVADSARISKPYFNYVLSGSTLAGGAITRAANTTENPEDRYYVYHSQAIDALIVFSVEGYAGKGKGWYLIPAATVTEPVSAGGTLSGVDFGSITDIYDADDSFSFSGFSGGTFAVYLGANCEYVIFGPCRQFVNAGGQALTFIPEVAHRTFRALAFDNVRGKRAALRGVHVRGGVRNFYSNIGFERFIPSDVTSANVPASRYFVDVETVNSEYVSGNSFDNVSSEDATMTGQRETVRDQGFANSFKRVLDNRSKGWQEFNRRYFRTSATGVMRQVLDNTPILGVTWPLINGKVEQNTTATLDSINWAGFTGFRIGYELYVRFTGVTSGRPTLNVKGGAPGSLATLHSTELPNSSDFELNVHIQFLDNLAAPAGTPSGYWISVSHVLRDGTSHEAGADIVDLNATGGTRQIAFEVVCENNEQLDLFAYSVEAKTNT